MCSESSTFIIIMHYGGLTNWFLFFKAHAGRLKVEPPTTPKYIAVKRIFILWCFFCWADGWWCRSLERRHSTHCEIFHLLLVLTSIERARDALFSLIFTPWHDMKFMSSFIRRSWNHFGVFFPLSFSLIWFNLEIHTHNEHILLHWISV